MSGPQNNMHKQKILIFTPLLSVAGLLLYCWTTFLLSETLATWKHYVGLLLFIPLVLLFFKSLPKVTIGLGIYLLLATFNLLAIMPAITTTWLNIGSSGLYTPPVQLSSLGLFILYFIMNLDSLINIHLDYKETKALKVSE